MNLLGRIIFWAGWPFWFFYLKIFNNRSRVLVVHNGKLLLIRTWLGSGNWGLPGGGAKHGELIEDSAIRELKEEVGVTSSAKQLEPLGKYIHTSYGLKFQAHFFLLNLDQKIELKLQKSEVAEARWCSLADISKMDCNEDSKYALKEFGHRITV